MLERGCARVEARFVLVHEHKIERVDQVGQAAVVGERLIPAEIPRGGDAASPKRGDNSSPVETIMRVETKVNMGPPSLA